MRPRRRTPNRGAALIIILAFIVLLTGLVVAYFSRATTDRQVSNASLNNTAADLLARSALDIVVSDFKQEITNAGTVTPDKILPKRSGNPSFNPPGNLTDPPADPIPNLIRRSYNSGANPPDPIAAPGVQSRASLIHSDSDVSLNGRSISTARWNSHVLVPRANPGTSDTDTTPVSSFKAPDWVLMTRNGPKIESWSTALYDRTPTNPDYVVGRYAYAVYDEGGLLDINVAGYPYGTGAGTPSATDIGRKGILAFADLEGTSGTTIMTSAAASKFVLFRNYATADSTIKVDCGTSAFFTSVCGTSPKGFLNFYLGGCTTETQAGTTQDFGQVNRVSIAPGPQATRTDQNFMSRQELMRFRYAACRSGCSAVANLDVLQYLGTFSRSQNLPTWPKLQGSTLTFPARFFMNKLSNIAANSTSFGLQNVGGQWQYWGAGGTGPASAIPAMTNPATADFFQLLNYALHGIATDPNRWDPATPDTNNIATTLAVGAALIDQYDTDSAVTRIDYGTGATSGTVYGMEGSAAPAPAPSPPLGYYSLNRPFRNVGDLGYVYKQGSIRPDQTIDFRNPGATTFPASATASLDTGLLDFLTFNGASPGSGTVNLNTRQAAVLTAILNRAITQESPLTTLNTGTTTLASGAARTIVNTTESASGSSVNAATSRADAARLASLVTGSPFTIDDQNRETVARALAEVTQTRTWGLLIDLVAQTGHYSPSSGSLAKFYVDGEKRYWLHVAIDRFDGSIVGQQLEEVFE